MNKTQLGELVADKLGVTHKEAHEAVLAVLDSVAETLLSGENVNVTNFGTFRVAERQGGQPLRNFHTGQVTYSGPHPFVTFRPSPSFRKALNSGDVEFSARKRGKA